MNKKRKTLLVSYFIIFMFFITAFQTIKVRAVDDNYTTYLYNQDINVDNDKAHLQSESSDGSNSYRNLFQSNFLFPAKLQNNMLSTTATSSFSHYSFNQFYFDNLDNDYAYQSNDNLENFETSIIPNEFDVINGSNIINGSLDYQDSEFGKYNATYNFDDYQETESNYGYYYMSQYDDFNNEVIGTTGTDIKWVNITLESGLHEIINEYENHKNVLRHETGYAMHQFEKTTSETWNFWTNSPNTAENTGIMFADGLTNCLLIKPSFYSAFFKYYNGSEYIQVATNNNNEWYHHKIVIRADNTFDWYINSILEVNNQNLSNNMNDGIDRVMIWAQNTHHYYIDSFGMVNNDDSYNENDNTNPYGLQSELESNFNIPYSFNIEYSINQTSNYHNNVIVMKDLSNIETSFLTNIFDSKVSGIVEFDLCVNESNTKFTDIKFQWNGIYLRIMNGLFQYHDGISFKSTGLSVINNKFYHHKIIFNCSTDLFSWYIDNVKYADSISFYGNLDYITHFYIYSISTHFDYIIKIDNIDYSWINGYYENRINDVIPLNDSNYNMYKSEFQNYETIDIYPNQDIPTVWNYQPSHGESDIAHCIDENEATRDNSNYASYSFANPTVQTFGMTTSDLENRIISKIEIKSYSYALTTENNFSMRYSLDIGSTYSDYTFNWISGSASWYSFIYDNVNISQSELDDFRLYCMPYDPDYVLNFYNYAIFMRIFIKNNTIDIVSETDITYLETELKPVLFTLNYSLCSNYENDIEFYIYNYDIGSYFNIQTYNNYLNFIEYSFVLNESAYFRLDKFKIRIQSEYYLNHSLFIDKISLDITYIIQNNEGYQEILIYNHRYDISDSYLGYALFEFRIYNDSIKYRYSEINFETDNYIYSWITYNTSSIDVKNIEIQAHCRYGLNTLDIEIINFYYLIYINYDIDNVIEFREQTRKELSVQKIKSSFNYTSYTKNYLDLTGIIGNYSYNCFNGMRSLYGSTDEIFHRYFNIPYFSQDIDVSIPLTLPIGSDSNPSEPTPLTDYYWTYESFETEYYQTVQITVGNWSVDFNMMRSKSITAKYYYQPNSVDRDDLGSWKWKIKFSDSFSYTIDFNFMRNAITSIINLVLLFAQWIMYLVVGGLSYIFMYLGTTILVFLWNFLIFYLFTGLIYVLWYVYEGLYTLLLYIWEGLVWVYENLFIPFLYWLWEYAVPVLIDWLIIILAHIITIIIWLITLGEGNYDDIYDNVYTMLRYIADEIIQMIITFLNNFEYIILFILYYLLLTGLVYVRYLYCKARGFNNRAEQLKQAFDVFIIPIQLTLYLFKTTKDLVDPYTS